MYEVVHYSVPFIGKNAVSRLGKASDNSFFSRIKFLIRVIFNFIYLVILQYCMLTLLICINHLKVNLTPVAESHQPKERGHYLLIGVIL